MAVRDDLISMSSTYRRMLGLKIDNSGSNGFRTSPGIVGVKPGRKWWRFPGENPGENGSVHACRSMMLEDGADAHYHRLCRGTPKCEETWRIGKRFASGS